MRATFKKIALRTFQAIGILFAVALLAFMNLALYFDQVETRRVMAEIEASRR